MLVWRLTEIEASTSDQRESNMVEEKKKSGPKQCDMGHIKSVDYKKPQS